MGTGMSALIAGATGLVGGELLELLLADPTYGKVTVLVRRPLPVNHGKLEQRVVDFDRVEDAADAFGVDAVFCCLGTTMKKAGSQAAFRRVDLEYPLKLGELARAHGAAGYYLVSSMGADPHSRVFYSRVKGEVEAALAGLGLPALHIFRPSLLLGERAEGRLGEAVAAVLLRAGAPFMVGGLRPYRAIEGRDVARAMVAAAKRGEPGVRIYRSDEIAALSRAGERLITVSK